VFAECSEKTCVELINKVYEWAYILATTQASIRPVVGFIVIQWTLTVEDLFQMTGALHVHHLMPMAFLTLFIVLSAITSAFFAPCSAISTSSS
jgi:hypothetical protein